MFPCNHISKIEEEIDILRTSWHKVSQNICDFYEKNLSVAQKIDRVKFRSLCEETETLFLSINKTFKTTSCIQKSPQFSHSVSRRLMKLASQTLLQIAYFSFYEKNLQEISKRLLDLFLNVFSSIEDPHYERRKEMFEALNAVTSEEAERFSPHFEHAFHNLHMNLNFYPLDETSLLEYKFNKGQRLPKPFQCQDPLETVPELKDPQYQGIFSSTGPYEYFVGITQGARNAQEDRYLASHEEGITAFAVFDGHLGATAANWLREKFFPIFFECRFSANFQNPLDLVKLFKNFGPNLQYNLMQHFPLNRSGATIIAAFIIENRLWVLNLGDARALLCCGNKAICLTEDARADHPDYKKPLFDRFGRIHYEMLGGSRTHQTGQAYGHHPARFMSANLWEGINPRFKITSVDLDALPKSVPWQLYLASDGPFECDTILNEQWFDFAQGKSIEETVEGIINHAQYRRGHSSYDNITIIGVDLNEKHSL